MTKNTQITTAIADAQADTIITNLNNGYLRIYTGTQPTNANTALSGQTLLAELRFAATSGTRSSGVITFNTIAAVNAVAGGTAAWYRCLKSDGTTVVMDGNIGGLAADTNMNLSSTTVVNGALFTISSFSHTVNLATSGY